MTTTVKSTKQLAELILDVILTLLLISEWHDAVEYFQFNQTVEIFFKVTGILFAYCGLLYLGHCIGIQIGLHLFGDIERKNLK